MPTMLEHRYEPRGACRELMYARDDEVLLSGPAGTGKSRGCLEKMHRAALKYPGMRGLILRKTLVSLTSSGLVTFREKVAQEALSVRLCYWFGGSMQEAACYRYRNGSVINVGGMDNPTKIMSTEYDMIYVQEAVELTLNDWESCTARLRNGVMPYQQIIADTNPDAEHHWLNKRSLTGQTRMLHSRHQDNPLYLNPDGTHTPMGHSYILGKLEKLTGVRRARLYLGHWVSAEGQVYDTYDPATHLIDRFPIPHDWPRYWSVDFGFTNPFVLQCWARDPDGRLYLYREIYRTGRLVEDHARDILSVVAPRGEWLEPRPERIICDHDAEDRATLTRHLGIGTTPATKTVRDGVQAVTSRLQIPADGRPRLALLRDSLIHRDETLTLAGRPACTAEEFPSYIWPPGTKSADTREAPVKENDHGMDAMRYVIMDQDRKKRARFDRYLGD